MKMTRLLVATLFLALGACAGSIDEPGEGADDSSADGSDDNADNSDNADNNDNADNTDDTDGAGEPDAGEDPAGPTFAAVYTILSGTCVGCHKAGSPIPSANDAINFEGDAATVYATVKADPGTVTVGNSAASKLFNKPTQSNGATHGGGQLFAGDSANGTTIAEWIDGGANE
jgi:hypothetical protein